MEILAYFEQIRYLNELIRQQRTGTPEQLAKKMQVSVATVYRRIRVLKEAGAPIKYCKRLQRYMYTVEDYNLKMKDFLT